MNISNPLIKIKGVFLKLGFKAKLVVLAAVIVVVTLPAGLFLYHAIADNDKQEASDIVGQDKSGEGEVAGESTSEPQNSFGSSPATNTKASPTPTTLGQSNQSSNNNGSNNASATSNNNSQSSNGTQQASPTSASGQTNTTIPVASPTPTTNTAAANLSATLNVSRNGAGDPAACQVEANKPSSFAWKYSIEYIGRDFEDEGKEYDFQSGPSISSSTSESVNCQALANKAIDLRQRGYEVYITVIVYVTANGETIRKTG